jgi:hypothetical protein
MVWPTPFRNEVRHILRRFGLGLTRMTSRLIFLVWALALERSFAIDTDWMVRTGTGVS